MKIDEMIETHIFKIIVVIPDEGGVQPKLVGSLTINGI